MVRAFQVRNLDSLSSPIISIELALEAHCKDFSQTTLLFIERLCVIKVWLWAYLSPLPVFVSLRQPQNDLRRCERELPLPSLPHSVFESLLPLLKTSSQVLRYSALGGGVFYGIYHQSKLSIQTKAAQTDREYKRKERLMAQAKAEWTKRTMPQDKVTQGGHGEFEECCLSVLLGLSDYGRFT